MGTVTLETTTLRVETPAVINGVRVEANTIIVIRPPHRNASRERVAHLLDGSEDRIAEILSRSSNKDAAALFGVKPRQVQSWRERLIARGVLEPLQVNYSAERRAEVLRMRESGLSFSAIARKFSMPLNSVASIVRRARLRGEEGNC